MKIYPNKAGIYKFTCSNNGKIYIGKSVNLYKRLNRHKNSKGGYYFDNAILKHGWDSFTVEILEVFENFDKLNDNLFLLERETYYIDLFNSDNREKGYNICRYSTDTTGIPLSEEHKEKIRKSNLGKTRSDSTKEKMRRSQLGKKLSIETKEKLRQINLGKKHSEDQKAKTSQTMTGRIFSAEHKENVRQSKLGKPRSEETKEKIRQTMLLKRIQSENLQ